MPIEQQRKFLVDKHRRQLDMLAEVGISLQNLLQSNDLYSKIIEIIQSRFHYYHMSLWTVDDQQEVATLQAHSGAHAYNFSPGFQIKGQGITAYVISTQKAYLSNNVSTDSKYTSLNFPTETKSSLCIPVLSLDGKLYALINIESMEMNAFDQDDLHVMQSVAAQVSLALSNAFFYNEINDFNKHLKEKIEDKTKELRTAHERILLQQRMLKKENQVLKTIVKSYNDKGDILGKSHPIKSLLSMIDKLAPTDVTALIHGESGSGKKHVAHRIHQYSDRTKLPFVQVNCGTTQKSLLESTLFGYEKTSNGAKKIGALEAADGGTLFIEEIESMSLPIQAKLLRCLQEKAIQSSSKKHPTPVNVRLVSATSRDLEQEVKEGNFREDLFYRINTITLRMPPLRERPEDIPLLLDYFLNNSNNSNKSNGLKISNRALEALQAYRWPGNVRELKNTVERLTILTDGDTVRLDELPFSIRMSQKNEGSNEGRGSVVSHNVKHMTLDELEKSHILQMLSYQSGNKTKTAKALGITIKTLYNKLHHYGIFGKDKANKINTPRETTLNDNKANHKN